MSNDPNNKYSWDLEDDVQASLAKEAIEILDKNRAQLHTVLRRFDAYKPAERRDARRRCVDEFLMLLAENSGVTSDLVHPGSHKHRVRERDNLARHVQATTGTYLKSPNPYLAPNSTQAPIRLAPPQHGQHLHPMPANGMNGHNGAGPNSYPMDHHQPYPSYSGFPQPPPQDAQQQQQRPPFQYVFSGAAPSSSPNPKPAVPSAGPVPRSLPVVSPPPAPAPVPEPSAPTPVPSPKPPVPSPQVQASPPPEVPPPPPPRAISPLVLGSAVGVGSPPAATPRGLAAVASPAPSKTSRRVSPAPSKIGSPPQVPPKSPAQADPKSPPPVAVASPVVVAPEVAPAPTPPQVPPAAVQRVVPVFFALPENSLLLDIHSQAGHISEIIANTGPQAGPAPLAMGAPAPLSPVPASPAPSGISVGTSRRKEMRSPPTGQPGTPGSIRSPPMSPSSYTRLLSRPASAASVGHVQAQRMQHPGPIAMPAAHPATPVLKLINPTPEGNIVSVLAQGTGSSDYRLSLGSASASPGTALAAVLEEGRGAATEGTGEERGGFSTWRHAEEVALARALEGNVREGQETRVRGGLADEYYEDGRGAGAGAPNENISSGASAGGQPDAPKDAANA